MRFLGFCCALIGVLAASAPAAQAQQFGIENFTGMVFADETRNRTDAYSNTGGRTTDAYPDPSTGGTGIYDLAGGHPFIGVTDFSFNRVSPTGPPAGGNVEELRVDIPRGLMPNPRAFARCTDAQLEALACPIESQIGSEELRLHISALAALGDITVHVPLYNMTPLSHPEDPGPRRDTVARFAFHPAEAAEAISPLPPLPPLPPPLDTLLPAGLQGLAAGLANLHSVHIVGGVRDEPTAFGPFDYGLFFTIDHLPAYNPANPASPGVVRTNLTFWGAPGDPAHNPAGPGQRGRGVSCVALGNLPNLGQFCTPIPSLAGAPDPSIPFLSNPTECTNAPLVGRLTVFSHPQAGGQVLSDTRTDQTPAIVDRDDGQVKNGAQECQQLSLAPAIDLRPGTDQPDTPVGPEVAISMANEGLANRNRFAESHAKDISVTLPPGLTINPSVANGLQACTDDQFAANVGVPAGEACPAASRIGDVRVISPLLPPAAGDDPNSTPVLTGSAYVGQPLANDQYRLFLTIEGREVSIRLKGSIQPDPNTGQITAIFRDNPQLPFDRLAVDFRDGSRAPLATPLDCGPKAASTTVTPWSGTAPVTATSPAFNIGGASCPVPFRTNFDVATASPGSGQFSPLSVHIGRGDRNQFLSKVRVDAPPGLAAKIKGVTQCEDAAANTGACPPASRIGTVTTTAGAGSEPYRLSGPVYLTEDYKGAPFGMVAVIRAIAGPYDLGTVVVRQQLHVDPEDASVTVVSDPLPQILEGVPIRLRSVDVTLDRRGFTYNPTSCGTKEIGGRMHSINGTVGEHPNAFIRFAGCDRLGFTPRMRMRLTGARQMRQGGHPGLRARVTQRASQSNIASAVVRLPKSLALDPANAQAVCGFEAAQRAKCPRKTRIGKATAVSPVLNRPLRGPVYFVQGIRIDPETGNRIRTLPSLLVKLNGEIRINLRATTDVRRGALVSTFPNVPDAPVSRFSLSLKGGKGGVLAATGRPSICGRRQVAIARTVGHNGKRAKQRRVRMTTKSPCRKLKRIQAKAKKRKAAAQRRARR
ncbi:MAG TPA: hypothetical protein VHF88_07555 [Thermoleophilaceae bacterium]|nr:hypothetical protein [Thermoleophilaceae bacterium]